jgi:hypothetical protein
MIHSDLSDLDDLFEDEIEDLKASHPLPAQASE